MVVPGDPLFEVLKYRISSLTLKERFQPNNILRWLCYLFMHRKLNDWSLISCVIMNG